MLRPASILLVEDNPMDVELIIDAFKEARLGNKIHVAGNGKEPLNTCLAKENMLTAKKYSPAGYCSSGFEDAGD